MAQVERLMIRAQITIDVEPAASADVRSHHSSTVSAPRTAPSTVIASPLSRGLPT